MAKTETPIWRIRSGRSGDADDLLLKKHHVARGWAKIGDLGAPKPDPEAFKAKVAECYPDEKAGAIPTTIGQL